MKAAKYKYSTFDEMITPGDCHFYGIIYDASFPMLDEHNNGNNQTNYSNEGSQAKYECTIKLIDQEVNALTHPIDFNDKIINLIIKSNNKEGMPYIHSIGDIIRVHHGNYVRMLNYNYH